MNRFDIWLITVIFAAALLLGSMGCGKGGGASLTPRMNLSNNVTDLTAGQFFRLDKDLARMAATIGQNSTTGLEVLKYYVTGISLCQQMTIGSGGANGTSGCVDIITPIQDPNFSYTPQQDYSSMMQTAITYESKFTDFMNATSREALGSAVTLTKDNVGTYVGGTISVEPVLIAKGSAVVGSTTYRTTSDGTISHQTSGDCGGNCYTTVSPSHQSSLNSTAEAVLLLSNVGTYFKFQTPMTISQSDIDNKTQFAMDLTFNPVGLLKVWPSGGPNAPASGGGGRFKDADGNIFLVPQMSASPAFRKSTENTMIETYTGTVSVSGGANEDIRLQLYYDSADTTKAIRGVGADALVNSNSGTLTAFPPVNAVTTNSNGTLNFQDWSQANMISNFKRGSKLGDQTTPTITCFIPNGIGVVVSCNGTTSVTFTLTEVGQLNP